MSLVRLVVALMAAVVGVSFWISHSNGSNNATSDVGATSKLTSAPGSSAPVSVTPTKAAVPVANAVKTAPLANGEKWVDLSMPGGVYVPQASNGGTDDYRCIILDPKFTTDTFLTGVVLEPGNAKLVHHAILYRADPDQAADARALDNQDPRLGWSCFGGPGLPSKSGGLGFLDSAPWVAAFATKGGEQRFAEGTGQKLAKGSLLILQVHYNLLNGDGPDYSKIKLRVAPANSHLKQIETMLLPGPVELPCPAGVTGPLCDRAASVSDVVSRFGFDSSFTIAGLQMLCGGDPSAPKAGPTQSCTRPVPQTMQIGAVAGHMHMLGKSISVDLIRADGSQQRLLDVANWDFDNQQGTRLSTPVTVGPGDKLKVTCTHDATLRSKIPSLKKLQPRYVVWGEGSSDEMCLGIINWVQP